jgi:hypothetical protein
MPCYSLYNIYCAGNGVVGTEKFATYLANPLVTLKSSKYPVKNMPVLDQSVPICIGEELVPVPTLLEYVPVPADTPLTYAVTVVPERTHAT